MKLKVLLGCAAILAVLALIVFSTPSTMDAQSTVVNVSNNSFTADMDADEETVAIQTDGRGGCAVVITGTWVGTIVPELSVNGGTTYVATQFYNIVTRTVVDSTTANGSFVILGVGGVSHARVRMDAYTSGTATGVIRSTSGAFTLPADRDITVIKAISDTSGGGTADITIWTPASGKKPRIMGFTLNQSIDATITLRYGTAATNIAIWPLATGDSENHKHLNFGESGFLINTADATVYLVKGAATIVGGAIWGREE